MTTAASPTSYALARKSTNPAFGGSIVTILGHDYAQAETLRDAWDQADRINAACAGMTAVQVAERYKLEPKR